MYETRLTMSLPFVGLLADRSAAVLFMRYYCRHLYCDCFYS